MAAFALSAFKHAAATPFSRTIVFCSFRLLIAFEGHIFATFALPEFDGRIWQLLLSPHSPTARLPPFTRTIVFLQISRTHSIRRSYFGSVCSIAEFDGRILAAFPLSASSHAAIAPHSRVRSHFCSFRSLLAFNGRILTTFPQSGHTTVAFWQLFLSPHSPPPPLPPVFAYDRIFATFVPSPHSTVAFWQLFLSAFSHAGPAPRSRVRSHICCFRSLSAFNGRILAAFPLSAFSHAAPAPRSRVRSHFCGFHSL